MFLPNQLHDHHKHLDPADAETLGLRAAKEVERYLTYQDNHPTPLHSLPALAAELGVGAKPLQNPAYDFNDDGLLYGARFHTAIIRQRLPSI